MKILWAVFLAVSVPVVAASQGAEALQVTFVVNDAFVKDRLIEGVAISVMMESGQEPVFSGVTGSHGSLVALLPAATYKVNYSRGGYVPIGGSETTVHSDGQIITTALSMLLEAEGSDTAHRIRIILNWGSDEAQVRDADSHLLCACRQDEPHVYYVEKSHSYEAHAAELDVDDTDWGGPETITISDPAPGQYLYWVHDYSGPPAVLGESDVVVRVLFDDVVGGEFRAPAGVVSRSWRPFKSIVVEQDLRPRLVRFSDQELGELLDREPPSEADHLIYQEESSSGCLVLLVMSFVGVMILIAVITALVVRARRR